MSNNNFNTSSYNNQEEIFIKDSGLSLVFSLCSLAFSASVIGLFVNFFINLHDPKTHLIYLAGMFISVLAGVFVNLMDKNKIRRDVQSNINHILHLQD